MDNEYHHNLSNTHYTKVSIAQTVQRENRGDSSRDGGDGGGGGGVLTSSILPSSSSALISSTSSSSSVTSFSVVFSVQREMG